MNEYVPLADLKSELGITDTADDARLQAMIERASRAIDELTHRHFFVEIVTRKFDYPGTSDNPLFLDDDLLALTTLTNGDGVAIAATDYLLRPPVTPRKTWVELLPSKGAYWLHQGDTSDIISVLGRWGYSEDWKDSGGTVQDAAGMTAVQTTLLVQTGKVKVGHTLRVESEQMFVSALAVASPNDTATVSRGVNGTTAATHALAKKVEYQAYPPTVVMASLRMTSWLWKRMEAPFERTALPELGAVIIPTDLPKDVVSMLGPFTKRWK